MYDLENFMPIEEINSVGDFVRRAATPVVAFLDFRQANASGQHILLFDSNEQLVSYLLVTAETVVGAVRQAVASGEGDWSPAGSLCRYAYVRVKANRTP